MDVDSPGQLSTLSSIAGAFPPPEPLARSLTMHADDAGAETAIPSASSILAAKEKRDRLRKSKVGEDFISLSLTKRDDFSQGPHPESRLMREEDELGDADDGKHP